MQSNYSADRSHIPYEEDDLNEVVAKGLETLGSDVSWMRMNDSTHIAAATTPATPPHLTTFDDIFTPFALVRRRSLDDLQVDLAYAALDVYADVDVRLAVGVVDVRAAHLLEPLGIDLAQATFGFRLNPNPAWKQYRCLSYPALYAGVEVLCVITREIHRGLARPHLKINSC